MTSPLLAMCSEINISTCERTPPPVRAPEIIKLTPLRYREKTTFLSPFVKSPFSMTSLIKRKNLMWGFEIWSEISRKKKRIELNNNQVASNYRSCMSFSPTAVVLNRVISPVASRHATCVFFVFLSLKGKNAKMNYTLKTHVTTWFREMAVHTHSCLK